MAKKIDGMPAHKVDASMDDIDNWDWVEDPEFGPIPYPKGSAPALAPAPATEEPPFDDRDDLERRQDSDDAWDDEAVQAMEQAPQHAVPFFACGLDRVKLTTEQLSETGMLVKRRTIKRHRDGTVETHEQDGTVRTEFLDGTVTTQHPCGRVETELRESTIDGDTALVRRQTHFQQLRNRMKLSKDLMAPSDPEGRKHVARGRRAGPSLPSNSARRLAEAGQNDQDERPDVLMVGGRNILPELQDELSDLADKGELNMRPGSEKLLHDERSLEAPDYLKHFAGPRLADDWAAQDLDVDREEREWRRQHYRDLKDPDRKSDREKLLQEFKIRKGFKLTEVEQEEWDFERPKRQEAYSKRLEQLKANLAEEKARSAKREAKVRARQERLDRDKQEAEEALRRLEEEEDIENRVYPDAVPAYLMDRPQYFFFPSKLPGNKLVLAEAQQPVVVVVGTGPSKGEPESEDEIEIVDAPPDGVHV